MKGYRKILIVANASHDVLKKGLDIAVDEKCWVTVLKVIPPYEGELDLTGVRNICDVLDSGSRQAVSAIDDFARKEGALAKVRIEEGDIPETISRVASEERCDLVVLGTKKKRGFIERLLGTNVLGKVLENAPCPVLIVEA